MLISAGLSASLALLGCATNGVSSLSGLPSSGSQNTSGQAVEKPAGQAAEAPVLSPAQPKAPAYFDWSSDRILRRNADFKTASFVDSLKPSLDLPPVVRQIKEATTSGGLTNTFAKNLPGADKLSVVPDMPTTPAAFGETSFFLTGSTTSANVFALASNGQISWELNLHENGKFDGGSLGAGTAAGVNTLYAITDKGRLYAINATTGLVISFAEVATDEFHKSSPFVVADGANDRVYLASDKGRVYRYTFNGTNFTQDFNVKPVSSSNTGRFSSSALATGVTAITSHVYVGSEEGRLYKLDPVTGATISMLELNSAVRSSGCQIMATMAIDSTTDIGIVPCGSYLFKIRLNDASNANMSLSAQSPLLELRQLITLAPTRVLGPSHNTRPLLATTLLREPKPTKDSVALEQPFGFKKGDFVRVETSNMGSIYGDIDQLTEDGKITFKTGGLFPIASPSPEPLLLGTERTSLANWAVRPAKVPEAGATPFPTPTPLPAGSDPVTRFPVGNPENLTAGDLIRFPTLPGAPVAAICSSTNADCDLGSGGRIAGIQRFVPNNAEDQAQQIVTVPGTALQAQIDAEMASTRYVPFEKLTNQVHGTTNSTISFEVANISGFSGGQTVRVTHQNGSTNGRHEYGVISSVNATTRRITLISALRDAPAAGDTIEIVDPNNRAFGRVTTSLLDSSGNILSEPVLRGNGSEVYVQHGNSLFELNYTTDTAFRDSANYLVLQSGRLEQSNVSLTAQSRSRPLVVDTTKLLTVDTDPSGRTGIFLNRVLLPLSSTAERLNDLFPILAPNSLGQLPNRAETRPVLLGGSGFVMFGGGNGVAYKLHKDIAW